MVQLYTASPGAAILSSPMNVGSGPEHCTSNPAPHQCPKTGRRGEAWHPSGTLQGAPDKVAVVRHCVYIGVREGTGREKGWRAGKHRE